MIVLSEAQHRRVSHGGCRKRAGLCCPVSHLGPGTVSALGPTGSESCPQMGMCCYAQEGGTTRPWKICRKQAPFWSHGLSAWGWWLAAPSCPADLIQGTGSLSSRGQWPDKAAWDTLPCPGSEQMSSESIALLGSALGASEGPPCDFKCSCCLGEASGAWMQGRDSSVGWRLFRVDSCFPRSLFQNENTFSIKYFYRQVIFDIFFIIKLYTF